MAHRFTSAFQTMESSDHAKHMGRVGPLTPARRYPFPCPAQLQDGIEHAVLDRPSTKRVRNSLKTVLSKPGSVRSNAKAIFPIDPAANSLRRLPIRQAIGELHDENQGQAPWRLRGLTAAGIKTRKHLVAIDRPQLIAQTEPCVAFGKGRPGNTGSFLRNRDYFLRLQRHRSLHRLFSRYQYLGFHTFAPTALQIGAPTEFASSIILGAAGHLSGRIGARNGLTRLRGRDGAAGQIRHVRTWCA